MNDIKVVVIDRNDKKISSAYSAAETKKATIRLLRTIVVLTQTLKSLPDDVMMTMKLLYYDDSKLDNYYKTFDERKQKAPKGLNRSPCSFFTF